MKPRGALVLGALYVALVAGGLAAGQRLADLVAVDVRPINEPQVHSMIMTATGAYALASALPFVPGAEVGFGLMLTFGARIVPLVYVSMVLALTIAFLVGRLIPARVTAAGFDYAGLTRARDMVLRIAPLDANARLETLIAHAPRRFVPFLLRHRYVALGVAFNLPGNTLIGGGGGIALAAGMSGIYPAPAYLVTVALAVSPLPLLFLLMGARG